MASDLDAEKSTANAGDRFVALIRSSAGPSSFEGLDAHDIPHPTDSHPPLSQRLEALGFGVADLTSEALAVAPEPASDVVVTDRNGIEEAFDGDPRRANQGVPRDGAGGLRCLAGAAGLGGAQGRESGAGQGRP